MDEFLYFFMKTYVGTVLFGGGGGGGGGGGRVSSKNKKNYLILIFEIPSHMEL